MEENHSDALLCLTFIKNFVAVGSKDHKISVYDLKKGEVIKLVGHASHICCLGTLKNKYLISGGDINDNSIIIWDPKNWTIKHRLKSHQAAVTYLVDFNDGCHFASGSYDRRINIYSYV